MVFASARHLEGSRIESSSWKQTLKFSALMRESLLIASELGKKTVHAELGIHAKRSSIGCSMVWAHS